MKKTITLTLLIAGICFAGTSPFEINSTGAPASATGAPGDGSCGNIGCHDDNSANSGAAISSITIGGGVIEYVPGETYQVEISISETGVNRFGYQLVALSESDNKNAGTFNILDAQRTQIVTNYVDSAIQDRNYLTYTYDGTNEYSTGMGYWTAEWLAPAEDVGPIKFYYATVAADNDGSDNGDGYYLNSFSLGASSVSSVADIKMNEVSQNIYPNPANHAVFVSETTEEFSLYTIKGDLVKNIRSVSKHNSVDISDMTPGIYFVVTQNGGGKSVEKLIIR